MPDIREVLGPYISAHVCVVQPVVKDLFALRRAAPHAAGLHAPGYVNLR